MARRWPLGILLLVTAGGCFGRANLDGPRSASDPGTSQSDLCAARPAAPPTTPNRMRRLSAREYRNTLIDLVGAEAVSSAQSQFGLLPDDYQLNSFDTAATTFSAAHVNAYAEIAFAISAFVAANASRLQMLEPCLGAPPYGDSCLAAFVGNFGKRAFRRPLTQPEVDRFLALAKDPLNATDQERAASVVAALLQSPDLVNLVEITGPSVPGQDNLYALSGPELASRLSYTFWGAPPDAALARAAENGTLVTDEILHAQAQRLLNDARARQQMKAFYSQWLRTRNIPEFHYPSYLYPGDQDRLRAQMVSELEAYIDYVVWNQRGNYQTLLTSSESPSVGPELAQLYGVTPDATGRVVFAQPERRGLYGKAALVASGLGGTNPFIRGARLRISLMAELLHQPPPGTFDASEFAPPPYRPDATTRDRYEAKTANRTACLSCHSLFQDIGGAMEAFDPLGRVRSQEIVHDVQGNVANRLPLRTDGSIAVGDSTWSFNNFNQFIDELVQSGKGSRAMAQQWFRFAHGRTDNIDDTCAISQLDQALSNEHGSIQDMLAATAMLPDFKVTFMGAQ